jgi:hypothetical protein
LHLLISFAKYEQTKQNQSTPSEIVNFTYSNAHKKDSSKREIPQRERFLKEEKEEEEEEEEEEGATIKPSPSSNKGNE